MKAINRAVKDKITAKAKELLEGYDGLGIDTWDAVMYPDNVNGFDINVYQEDDTEPLSVWIYPVYELKVDTSKGLDITELVVTK